MTYFGREAYKVMIENFYIRNSEGRFKLPLFS